MGFSIATDFLVPTPSFITGMGACMNLSGGYFAYNQHANGYEADVSAIRRDWLKVAEDMQIAIARSKLEVSSEPR
jgi:hypothetical protein